MADYDAANIPGLAGRTVLITGGTSGIGRATAAALARASARVVLAVRNPDKGRQVAAELPGTVEVRALDLADLASIRGFAAEWRSPVDILVNNAGVWARSLQRTADGFELDFGTNHLGHFALTNLLLPRITERVITLSSQAERAARLNLADPNWQRRRYSPGRAYSDSKLANLLFTAELDRRLRASKSDVRALAVHPGLVITPMYDTPGAARRTFLSRILPYLGQDTDHGALPVLFAATEDLPGDTFVGPQHLAHMRGGAQVIKRSAKAKDRALAARLWELSQRSTGLDETI